MSGAGYIDEPLRRSHRTRPHLFAPFLSMLMVLLVAISAIGVTFGVKKFEAEAGPPEWIVCTFFDGQDDASQWVRLGYDAAYTDSLNYMLFSKSVVSSGVSDVTGGLNNMLSLTHDFKKTNNKILGRGFKQGDDYEGKLNKGSRVNPYDRFGLAGLRWTSYSGEWAYSKVDPCNAANTVDMKIGDFYEGRLAPESTFGDAANSTDVRTVIAANKFLSMSRDTDNVIANGIFNATKFIVASVNALIGLAFSDIVGATGLENLISSPSGIFNKLYKGIYLPLLGLIMLVMAGWALYKGIFRREYRRTLGGIGQSILMVFIAAVMAFQPMFFMALPNNAAVVIQSVVVNAMGSSLYGGDGLCAVGGHYIVDPKGKLKEVQADSKGNVSFGGGSVVNVADPDDAQGFLEQSTKSMQSIIGCQIWNQYAFKPWVEGQFGTDFNNLWAKGHKPNKGFSDMKTLNNSNDDWVGDATVPLGGGYELLRPRSTPTAWPMTGGASSMRSRITTRRRLRRASRSRTMGPARAMTRTT